MYRVRWFLSGAQYTRGLGQEHASGRCEGKTMWSAFEQYRAEFFLKRAYLLGQRRLRDVQPRRGGAERPALPDGEKILELTQSRQMKLPSAVRSTSKSRRDPRYRTG